MTQNTDQQKGLIYVLITVTLWGILPIAQKYIIDFLPPTSVVAIRFLISGLILFSYFIIFDRKILLQLKNFKFILIIAGLGLGCNYVFSIWGLHYTSPNNSQIFIQFGPILVYLGGILIYNEKVSSIQLIGILLNIIGLSVFYKDQLKHFFSNSETYDFGVILMLIAAATWAIYALSQKYLVRHYHPQLINMFIYLLPGFIMLPMVEFDTVASLSSWHLFLLFLLALNTLFAYGFLALGIKHLPMSKISVLLSVSPLLTIFSMYILSILSLSWTKGETLQTNSIIGTALILMGVVLVLKKKKVKKI